MVSRYLLIAYREFLASHVLTLSPTPDSIQRRRQGLSGSWRTPMPACPALRPRRNPGTLAVSCQDVAFRRKHDVGFRSASFEAQSHGPQTPCVRYAAWVTPGPRNTRFRLPAVSPQAGKLLGSPEARTQNHSFLLSPVFFFDL